MRVVRCDATAASRAIWHCPTKGQPCKHSSTLSHTGLTYVTVTRSLVLLLPWSFDFEKAGTERPSLVQFKMLGDTHATLRIHCVGPQSRNPSEKLSQPAKREDANVFDFFLEKEHWQTPRCGDLSVLSDFFSHFLTRTRRKVSLFCRNVCSARPFIY